jgi:hypothetical protein
MTSMRRWLLVLAGTGLLVALPGVVAALPTPARQVAPSTLLRRVQQSAGVGFSGYAESDGGLALPVASQFNNIADLFGGHRQLRVWWRSDVDWRVDSIGYTGETDTHTTDSGSWNWNYESNTATFSEYTGTPRVRLPTDADLLPPRLAQRLLSEATAAEATTLSSRRVAGVTAAGLRIRPTSAVSTIDHVDVWADPRTGLPLSVSVYGKGSGSSALTSKFLDVKIASPARTATQFRVPAGAQVQSISGPDLATTIDRIGGGVPPARLAGIDRNPQLSALGSIGVYGRAVTEFIAVPLPWRLAYSLHNQLDPKGSLSGPGSEREGQVTLSAGPINLLLSSFDHPAGPWLLVGTVTQQTLAQAVGELTGPARRP